MAPKSTPVTSDKNRVCSLMTGEQAERAEKESHAKEQTTHRGHPRLPSASPQQRATSSLLGSYD